MEKPPILTVLGINNYSKRGMYVEDMLEAQRDADVEWYKGERREAYDRGYDRGIREEQGVIDGIKERCAERVEQAREEVAREIFEQAEEGMAGLDENKPELYQHQQFNVIPTRHYQTLKDKYNKQSIGR